jgi:hypothetical protein
MGATAVANTNEGKAMTLSEGQVKEALGNHGGTARMSLEKLTTSVVVPTGTDGKGDPDEAARVLAAVRKRADDWRTATSSVLGLITAALVLNTDAVDSVGDKARAYLAAALAASAVLGLFSLYKVIRAANGPSWLDTIRTSTATSNEVSAAVRDSVRARAAAHDLYIGQRALGVAVLIFIGMVCAIWIL